MALELAHLGEDDERRILKRVRTNADGGPTSRCSPGGVRGGVYEIVFEVGEYFAGRPEVGDAPRSSTAYRCGSASPTRRRTTTFHLTSPWSYSTYRGS